MFSNLKFKSIIQLSLLEIFVTRLIPLCEEFSYLITQESEEKGRKGRKDLLQALASPFPRLTYSATTKINVAVHEINPSQFKSPRESVTKG